MSRALPALVMTVLLFLAFPARAADPPPLHVAHGKVDKVEKESLVIQPREAGGKFGKPITLKVTGTSKVTTLNVREVGGKPILAQRDSDLRDLKPGQAIAVVYATLKDGNVLLSAVAQPSEK